MRTGCLGGIVCSVRKAVLKAFAATVGALTLLAAPAAAGPTGGVNRASSASAVELSVLVEVNSFRARHGLSRLRLSRQLSAAAGVHSRAMARSGFFGHDSANGTVFWKRIRHYYGARGYRHWFVGENLAWDSPALDGRGALEMWLASPPHRRVLLTPKWRELGVSAVRVGSAPGRYRRLPVTVITANFGVRR